jgi:Cu/Ag efflux protein CusF
MKMEGGCAMKVSQWLLLMLVLSHPALVGCTYPEADEPPMTSTTAETEPDKEYDITGKVVSVGSDRQSVTLDHEDVPGLMKGMEMEFRVEDPEFLEGIEVGNEVFGRLRVQPGNYTITKLKKR